MARQLIDAGVSAALSALYARAEAKGYKARAVAGVSLGGCCDAIGTTRKGAFRRTAHAHTSGSDPRRDWICVLSGKVERLVSPTGKPTATLIHEYAHILTHAGHTDAWRKAVAALGAPAEAVRYDRPKQ